MLVTRFARSQTDRVIVVDYSKPLQAMIAAGKYDWVNPDITQENFPVVGEGSKKFRTRLFDFRRTISSDAAVTEMRKENFTPASHVHGLAYGATFPDEHAQNPHRLHGVTNATTISLIVKVCQIVPWHCHRNVRSAVRSFARGINFTREYVPRRDRARVGPFFREPFHREADL